MERSALDALATSLDEREIVIGETTFRIAKLLPMDAFAVLELIREALGERLASLDADAQTPSTAIVSIVLALPRETVEAVRTRLFRSVTFTNRMARTARPLHPDEAMAFQGLDPIAIYEVLIRSFAINFFDSFRGLRSRIPAAESTSPPLATAT